MRSISLLPLLFLVSLLSACCQTDAPAAAATALPETLTLQPDQSALNFISIKNDSNAELHSFKNVTGSWAASSGELVVKVDLSSVETNIGIRNQRMQEFLFQVAQHPTAVLTSKLAADQLEGMVVGNQLDLKLPATLDLHGQQQALDISVRITKRADGAFTATTMTPVLIKAEAFGLVAGINKLRELAKLNNIAQSVPVTFSVTFR